MLPTYKDTGMPMIETLEEAQSLDTVPRAVWLTDHIFGFDPDGFNPILAHLNSLDADIQCHWHQIVPDRVRKIYPNLSFCYNLEDQLETNFRFFEQYLSHPPRTFQNFVCCFNGTDHASRKMIVALLKKMNMYDPGYVTKNRAFTVDILDGHITDAVGSRDRLYRKFFISEDSEEFFATTNSMEHERFRHDINIQNLERPLTESFVQIVTETMGISSVPYVTEKFMYSVVTRGLFVACAQPGWHAHLEHYYGFRPYRRLFDYRFDAINNPVERYVELVTMLSKYHHMSSDDWRDLYEIERDTIEYNYNHYFSGDYIRRLEKFR